jgi:cytoskeletal protein RodZ
MSLEMKPLPLVPDQSLHWGAALRAARLAKKLSKEQVGINLKLTEAQVDAIEREDMLAVHPSTMFVKGYVRNYAQLLSVDLPPDTLAGVSVVQPLHTVNLVNERFSSGAQKHKRGLWWLFGFSVSGILLWQFLSDAQLMVLIQ